MAKIKTLKKKIKESEELNDLTKTSVKDIFDGNIVTGKQIGRAHV